ncbi:hypothetical protein [Streptomyces melanogenes]|uniref:hypothetical protein n=1 Tax=Streptomyces melanogenes TaxID=67326 RepID=UPI00379A36D8
MTSFVPQQFEQGFGQGQGMAQGQGIGQGQGGQGQGVPQHLQQQLHQLGQQQPFQSLLQQFGQQPGTQPQAQPQAQYFVAYATAVQAPIAPFPGIEASMTLVVNGRQVRLPHPSQFVIERVLSAFRHGQFVRVAYDDRMMVKGIEIEASRPMQ